MTIFLDHMMVLLDLSAAFETVDHSIMLQQSQTKLRIPGTVLNWFCSYSSGRSQRVSIDGSSQTNTTLTVVCLKALAWDHFCSLYTPADCSTSSKNTCLELWRYTAAPPRCRVQRKFIFQLAFLSGPMSYGDKRACPIMLLAHQVIVHSRSEPSLLSRNTGERGSRGGPGTIVCTCL